VAAKELRSGDVIGEDDIDNKRPGEGISPTERKYVLGRKLKKNKEKDALLCWDDFE
jgi:sialic acid synthase SpsE